MKILTTKTDVENLRALRQRKAELKIRMEQERAALVQTWQEVRADMEPSKIAANVARSLLGLSSGPRTGVAGPTDSAALLQLPLKLATDFFLTGRTRMLVNLAAPLVLSLLPKLTQKARSISFSGAKTKTFGALRRRVAGLRSRLKRKKA